MRRMVFSLALRGNRPSQNPAFPPYHVKTLHLRGVSTPRFLPSLLELQICKKATISCFEIVSF